MDFIFCSYKKMFETSNFGSPIKTKEKHFFLKKKVKKKKKIRIITFIFGH